MTPDTIETSDGRTVPLSELEDGVQRNRKGWTDAVLFAMVAEVRRLRDRVAELEAGLRPFANCADTFVARSAPDSLAITVNMGQCRRADELLAKGTGS